jgi:hypothetical protein
MSKSITNILKEATNGILTPEVLTEIESLFNNAVAEKTKIHVESALIAQDEDYAKKLETLIAAIDNDHVNKLNNVVEAIDRKRTAQLQMVVEKYDRLLNKEAASFKNNLVENISTYLEAYIDEKIPLETIQEAVNNKKAALILEEIRTKLGVDMALASDTIREAVKDGKTQLENLRNENQALKEQNVQLTESNQISNAKLLIEEKISNFPADKKNRVRKMVDGKDAKYITENYEYIVKLVDKDEEEHLETLKEEALKDSKAIKVDRQVIVESAPKENEDGAPEHEFTSVYMDELKKW